MYAKESHKLVVHSMIEKVGSGYLHLIKDTLKNWNEEETIEWY